jgi:hypothetical protein
MLASPLGCYGRRTYETLVPNRHPLGVGGDPRSLCRSGVTCMPSMGFASHGTCSDCATARNAFRRPSAPRAPSPLRGGIRAVARDGEGDARSSSHTNEPTSKCASMDACRIGRTAPHGPLPDIGLPHLPKLEGTRGALRLGCAMLASHAWNVVLAQVDRPMDVCALYPRCAYGCCLASDRAGPGCKYHHRHRQAVGSVQCGGRMCTQPWWVRRAIRRPTPPSASEHAHPRHARRLQRRR